MSSSTLNERIEQARLRHARAEVAVILAKSDLDFLVKGEVDLLGALIGSGALLDPGTPEAATVARFLEWLTNKGHQVTVEVIDTCDDDRDERGTSAVIGDYFDGLRAVREERETTAREDSPLTWTWNVLRADMPRRDEDPFS